jgi:cold shock CspA family protein
MNGTIVSESGRGFWFVEVDGTSESVFIHHSHVAQNRYLHIGDRVSFEIQPNPLKPGQRHAVKVTYVGRNIPRQKGGAVQS